MDDEELEITGLDQLIEMLGQKTVDGLICDAVGYDYDLRYGQPTPTTLVADRTILLDAYNDYEAMDYYKESFIAAVSKALEEGRKFDPFAFACDLNANLEDADPSRVFAVAENFNRCVEDRFSKEGIQATCDVPVAELQDRYGLWTEYCSIDDIECMSFGVSLLLCDDPSITGEEVSTLYAATEKSSDTLDTLYNALYEDGSSHKLTREGLSGELRCEFEASSLQWLCHANGTDIFDVVSKSDDSVFAKSLRDELGESSVLVNHMPMCLTALCTLSGKDFLSLLAANRLLEDDANKHYARVDSDIRLEGSPTVGFLDPAAGATSGLNIRLNSDGLTIPQRLIRLPMIDQGVKKFAGYWTVDEICGLPSSLYDVKATFASEPKTRYRYLFKHL